MNKLELAKSILESGIVKPDRVVMSITDRSGHRNYRLHEALKEIKNKTADAREWVDGILFSAVYSISKDKSGERNHINGNKFGVLNVGEIKNILQNRSPEDKNRHAFTDSNGKSYTFNELIIQITQNIVTLSDYSDALVNQFIAHLK